MKIPALIAGEEYVIKYRDHALCDTFLKFSVVIRQVMRL